MTSITFDNPHLSSWNNELFQKIKLKNDEIKKMSGNMNELEELNTNKKNELFSLEKTMETTLNNVEKYIENYSNNISDKIKKIQNTKYDNLSNKSKSLFSLYKELYKEAICFFSRKEFKYLPSSLKIHMNDKFLNWLNSLFEEENYDGWTDVLTPIWTIENQYNDMEEKYKVLTKVFDDTSKKYEEKKKVYDKLTNDIEKMEKELNTLKEFSEKIKECHIDVNKK